MWTSCIVPIDVVILILPLSISFNVMVSFFAISEKYKKASRIKTKIKKQPLQTCYCFSAIAFSPNTQMLADLFPPIS
jgi:hypothetical protein